MNQPIEMASPLLSVVVPMYNEAEGIGPFLDRTLPVLRSLGEPFEIVCVNDGSTDATLESLRRAQRHEPAIRIVDLSRNFGKEAALSAGLDHARGAAVVPLDADLQDPPELIPEMLAKWREGYEVVLARRADRQADGPMKRLTARLFYRVHNTLADTPIPEDVGDFRLLDRSVLAALGRLPERRRFMKGLFAWVGFRTCTIPFVRDARHAGSSKWNWWRLWNLAIEGITSFSSMPLRLWSYVGCGISLLAFLYAAFTVAKTLILGRDVPGYASLIVVVLFLGGLQLMTLGLLGEYIGRIYTEVKGRPIYILRRVYGNAEGDTPPDATG